MLAYPFMQRMGTGPQRTVKKTFLLIDFFYFKTIHADFLYKMKLFEKIMKCLLRKFSYQCKLSYVECMEEGNVGITYGNDMTVHIQIHIGLYSQFFLLQTSI